MTVRKLYPKFVKELGRILRPQTGRAVLILMSKKVMQQCLADVGDVLSVKEVIPVDNSGFLCMPLLNV